MPVLGQVLPLVILRRYPAGKGLVMQVLKMGEVNNLWIGKCSKCKTVFQATTDELVPTAGDYRSDNEAFAWKDCSVCQSIHTVCFHQKGTRSANRDLEG